MIEACEALRVGRILADMKKISVLPVLVFGFLVVLASGGWAQIPDSLTNGLVAYYPFNGNATDESGNSLNGIPSGVSPTTDRFGVSGNAFNFSGEYLPESNVKVPGLSTGANRTVSVWINLAGGKDGPRLFSYSLGELTMDLDVGDLQRININNQTLSGGDWFATGGIDLMNQWKHIVGVWSGSKGRIYLNGVLEAEKVWNSSPTTDYSSGFTPEIGGNSGAIWDPFGGGMDDVAIWDRALSAAEVSDLYNAQAVPEPSTYALLLLSGVASLWALKHRKS